MKFISICVLVGLSNMACSQTETRIIKKCASAKKGGFVGKNYICQKLFYKDSELTREVNYSYNGWQIYDSISYEAKGATFCRKVYNPVYKDGSTVVLKYEVKNSACDEKKSFASQYLRMIDDKYFLSRSYLADLSLLLELKPVKSNDVFKFNDGVIPSIFNKYGIPYNAVLKSFSFSIGDDNLITRDNFYFSDYSVKRDYKYFNKVLQEVNVIVKNEKASETFDYKENFEIQR